jgi:hypothetical protein
MDISTLPCAIQHVRCTGRLREARFKVKPSSC